MKLKRLLSVLLCVAMIASLMVTTSFAETSEDEGVSSVEAAENDLSITKSVTDNGDGTYDLTMEAYASGKSEVTTKSVPMDIVLVLDVSGSMSDNNKINSMKTAAKAFISKIAADARTNSVDHKVAIVKFAGTKSNSIGNNTYREGYNTYNYSQIVANLTSASSGETALNNQVSGLKAGGATSIEYGLQLANTVLGTPAADRQQTVVVFTDGSPTHSSSFENSVANAAISASKTLKDKGATVYSVGMLNNPANNVKNFLQYVSSNYPAAVSMTNAGTKAAEGNYSLLVGDGDSLSAVFEQIANEAISSSATADETSVLTDDLTTYFNFKLNDDESFTSYTVKKAPCTGENTWGAAQDVSGVTVAQNGKNIDITGFNYISDENMVVKAADGNWKGNKLIVTFTIIPADDAEWQVGKHFYPTNQTAENKAGIYAEDGTELLVLNESPTLPMTAATVSYQVTGDKPATSSALPEESIYLVGETVAVAAGLTTTETTKDGKTGTWSFNGWDKTDDFAMTAENVVITGTWSFNYTEKTDVSMTKVWNDDDNRDGVRPDSISVQLLDSSNNAIGDAVTVTANDNWAHTWNVLKYNADGNEIAYHVVETSADRNYSASADGMTITNTHEVKTIDELTMTKVWADDDNRDGVRPDSIDVQLLANGEPCGDVVTVEANADGAWVYTWNDLYVNENGEPITYTVEEVNVDENYTASYSTDTLTVTNTHESAVTSKTVTKVWNDADNQDGIRPESVTVNLMNGEEIVARAVLNADNKWSYTWNDLYVNENGQAINYTVEEVDVAEGYESSVDGMVVTNTHEPEVVTIPVVKDWVGDTEAARPESITVNLLVDGEVVKTIKLTAENQWTGAFENVPVYANGEAIKYDVKEVAVDGYTVAYNVTENGVAIVNTLIPVDPEPTPVNPDPTPAPVPNTGDSSNMVLYIVLAVMALAGIAVVVLAPAKKHGKHSA